MAEKVIAEMVEESRKVFELPFDERSTYVNYDMKSAVRYGTGYNQNIDKVFCRRDFRKLSCPPLLDDIVPLWPSSPSNFRQTAVNYSKKTRFLYRNLVEAVLVSLGLVEETSKTRWKDAENLKEELENGSQLLVIIPYPPCPEPDLTLGIPPHSDYGLLTLLPQGQDQNLAFSYQPLI